MPQPLCPTDLCPWPPLRPDLPFRPTSPDPPRPAYAVWYSGNFGQKKLRGLNVRKSDIRPTENPACLKIYQFILIYWILILCHFICYTVSFYILYYDIGHPQHKLIRNTNFILFYFILFFSISNSSNSFDNFVKKNSNFNCIYLIIIIQNNGTKRQNFHRFSNAWGQI